MLVVYTSSNFHFRSSIENKLKYQGIHLNCLWDLVFIACKIKPFSPQVGSMGSAMQETQVSSQLRAKQCKSYI